MDLNAYINSGTLEQYCFELFNPGLSQEVARMRSAHPEVKQELNAIEMVIEKLAESQAIIPDAHLRDRVFASLDFAGEDIDLGHLPPTSKYSNYLSWLKAVEHLLPAQPFEDFFMEVLRHDEHIAQMLVVTKLDVPEEIHETTAESFFILKGTCECTVGSQVFTLNAGDYLDIPLHVNHDIKIISPFVVAILEHQFA
jgi:mannose-6-phosphate isomerase-like protein (cupin superfamily)